jgi:periplasmic protein TonB
MAISARTIFALGASTVGHTALIVGFAGAGLSTPSTPALPHVITVSLELAPTVVNEPPVEVVTPATKQLQAPSLPERKAEDVATPKRALTPPTKANTEKTVALTTPPAKKTLTQKAEPAPSQDSLENSPNESKPIESEPKAKLNSAATDSKDTTNTDNAIETSPSRAVSQPRSATHNPPVLVSPTDYSNNPPPKYPDSARRQKHQGTVLLLVEVDAFGHTTSVKIKKSSGHPSLDEQARSTVKDWHFSPTTYKGQNLASTVLVPIKFALTK